MKIFYIVILFFVSSGLLYAQPTLPPPIPIDGGVSLLVAAGIGYESKK